MISVGAPALHEARLVWVGYTGEQLKKSAVLPDMVDEKEKEKRRADKDVGGE